MSKIIFNNIQKPKHAFDITIEFLNDGDVNDYYFNLMSFGEFEYGNDNNKDNVYYPANTKIAFTIQGSDVLPGQSGGFSADQYVRAYHDFLRKLKYNETKVTINKDGSYFFAGFVDHEAIDSDFKEKSFGLFVLNDFAKLKDYDPKDEHLGLNPGTTDKVYFIDMIKLIVNKVLPDVTNILYNTDLRAVTNYTFMSEPWVPDFQYLADFVFNFVGDYTIHDDLFELLKDILTSFGLICVIYEDTILLQARWYSTALTVTALNKKDFNSGPNIVGRTKKIKGLQTLVRTKPESNNTGESAALGIVEKDKDGNIKNSDDVETIILSAPGGTPPGKPDNTLNNINLWAWVPEWVAGLGNGQWTTTKPNEFYLESKPLNKASLWQIIRDKVWSLVSNSRLVYEADIKSTNWLNSNYYDFPTIEEYGFRPRKFGIDYTNNKSTIEFVEGGSVDYSLIPIVGVDKFAKAIDVTFQVFDGSYPTPFDFNPGTVKPFSIFVRIEFSSQYLNSGLTATEYDGTDIVLDNADVWKTIKGYAGYQFNSYTGNSPQYGYPHRWDSEGYWVKIFDLPEEKGEVTPLVVRINGNIGVGVKVYGFFVAAYSDASRLPEVKK